MSKKYFVLAFILVATRAIAQQADSIVLDNAVLYYYTYGAGSPVLVFTGGPGNGALSSEGMAIALSKKYKAILVEQRGNQRSWTKPFDSTTINLRTAVNDIEVIRKHLRIEKLTMVGTSWGAMLIAAYTDQFPGQVKSLVMISGGELDMSITDMVDENIRLRRQFTDTALMNRLRTVVNKSPGDEKARIELRKLYFSPLIYDQSKMDVIVDKLERGGAANIPLYQMMWNDLKKTKFNVMESLPKKYASHALVVFGWQDPIGLTTLLQYRNAFPQAKIVGIEKAGHIVAGEQPEMVYKTVLQFLTETGQ